MTRTLEYMNQSPLSPASELILTLKMASLSKQETYRLLMKEKKAKRSAVPRIDHPLAKLVRYL